MKYVKSIVGLAMLMASLAAGAMQGGACQADVQRYCTQSGGGREVFECLLDHQQDVSDDCYEDLKRRMSADSAAGEQGAMGQGFGQGQRVGRGGADGGSPQGAEQCLRDVRQFCQGVQPGGGRIINCLMDHDNEISDGCYAALAKKAGQANR